MTTFDETRHARDTTGRFTEMAGAEQPDELTPSADPTGLREGYGKERLRQDADLARAIGILEEPGYDWNFYTPNGEQIAELIVAGIRQERWRDTPKPGALNEHSLDDVTTMGGDEIRAMTPRQRQHLHAKAVRAAERLSACLQELGEHPADGIELTAAQSTTDESGHA